MNVLLSIVSICVQFLNLFLPVVQPFNFLIVSLSQNFFFHFVFVKV